jgi:prepilin-type N-terminal cleavage/methylation domain-containing protein
MASQKHSKGFTIIEVMVAATIGVLLLFGAYKFAIYANRGTQRLTKLADEQSVRLTTKMMGSCFNNPSACPPISSRFRTQSGTFSVARGGRTSHKVALSLQPEAAICLPMADTSPGGSDWATCECYNRDIQLGGRDITFYATSSGSIDSHCKFFYLVLGNS